MRPNISITLKRRARALIESRLAYHLDCLTEAATDPELSKAERLALVQDRARKLRQIRRELAATGEAPRMATRGRP